MRPAALLRVSLAIFLLAAPWAAVAAVDDGAPPPALVKPEPHPGSPVASGELVEHPVEWNNRTIFFVGEAIGESMRRGDHAWIHLNDDAYMWKNIEEGAALGGYNSGHAVWVPAALVDRIAFYGDYKHDGDVVGVTGVFHAACREHGGDMDIHASELSIVRPGHPVDHQFNGARLVLALLLLSLAGLLYIVKRRHDYRRI